LPVELEVGCEVEPKLDPEGEEEPDAVDPPTDEAPPAVEEPPPAVDAPLDAVLLEWPPPQDEDADNEDEDEEDDEDEERSRFGGFPAGTASESTNTSPRMCSTYWAGTPDWFTGWVNTRCTPVAVTLSSLAPEFPPAPPRSNGLGAAVVLV
jgi:hypothetical protein